MAEVIISAFTRKKIDSLIDVLIDDGYFVEVENAYAYVNAIYQFAETIPTQQHYSTKSPQFGKWYYRYKANRNTSYYLTFDAIEDVYFVKNIINNHTKEYPIYIKDF